MIITRDQGSEQLLEERIQKLEEQLRESEYRNVLRFNQYELERIWWEDLLRNDWLSGDHKILLYVIRQIVAGLRYDWSEPVMIYSAELEHRTGLGRKSIIRLTQELHNAGLITRETRGKGKEKRTWYSLGGTIHTSAKDPQIKAGPRNHGGARCRKCGSRNIKVKTVHVCLDCGHEE